MVSATGRVLKVGSFSDDTFSVMLITYPRCPQDDDSLSVYKIQSSHTIHMVKGVSRSGAGGSSSSGAPATPQPLPAMQTGQNVHDPLTQLNSHMGFGAMAGLNPFGEMGLNPNDPNMVCVSSEAPSGGFLSFFLLQRRCLFIVFDRCKL